MKRIYLLLAILATAFLVAHLAPTHVFADALGTAKSQACAGAGLAGADCSSSTSSTGVSTLIRAVINILSVIVGIAAVIVIIISGLKYVTSGGDSNGISSAKNTLIYALVGLAVAALAQVLVHFVLYNVGPRPCPSDPNNTSLSVNSPKCAPLKKR